MNDREAMNDARTVAPCRSCGHMNWQPLFSKAGYDYASCGGCGVARIDPLPEQRRMTDLFSTGYLSGEHEVGYLDYDRDAKHHRRNAARWLRVANRHVPGRGRLLDGGCATGYLLELAQTDGWESSGVEIDPVAAAHVRRRLGVDVWHTFDQVPEGSTFDAIAMLQLIAHLEQPDRLLQRAADLLRPGGVLMIETIDRSSLVGRLLGSRWQQVTPPAVVWLFTRTYLETVLERVGFDVVQYRPSLKWVSARYVSEILSPTTDDESRSRSRLPDLGLPYVFGDLVQIVARRR